jgi:NADPH:quinone reductase
MRFVKILDNGALSIVNGSSPSCEPHEVLVKVIAAGMNRADLLQKRGLYPPPQGGSDILGLEISGIRTDINEHVCALLTGGGYAEHVAVHKDLCLPIPPSCDPIIMAGLPEAIYTVYRNLIEIGNLSQNDHLLIHGGASGIGTMAIQIAKLYRARITVTAGDDERCHKCITLGATRAINYKREDFEDILKQDKVDIVLDMVGGNTLTRTIPIMNKFGRITSIAYMESAKAEISIPHIMKQQLTLTGSTLRDQSLEYKIALTQKIKRDIWPFVIDGTIRPVIDRIFDMTDVISAHEYFEKGGHFGKILLKNG